MNRLSGSVRLLILDASTEARCSVSLHTGDDCFAFASEARRGHAQNMLSLVARALTESKCDLTDLDGVAFACGPGSFTGLRVCAATAQGLGIGGGLPLLPLSTLALMAQRWLEEGGRGLSVPTLDARQERVYWGVYEAKDGLALARVDDACSPIEELATGLEAALATAPDNPALIGDGCRLLERRPLPVSVRMPQTLPEARFGFALALAAASSDWLAPEQAFPTYLSGSRWSKSAAAPVT